MRTFVLQRIPQFKSNIQKAGGYLSLGAKPMLGGQWVEWTWSWRMPLLTPATLPVPSGQWQSLGLLRINTVATKEETQAHEAARHWTRRQSPSHRKQPHQPERIAPVSELCLSPQMYQAKSFRPRNWPAPGCQRSFLAEIRFLRRHELFFNVNG